MQFESVFNLSGLEVPNNDVSREAWESILGACDVSAIWGYFDRWISLKFTWDSVVVTSKESLGPREDVPHNDSGAQGIEDVLIIRVEEKPVISVAWESNNGVNFEFLFHEVLKI